MFVRYLRHYIIAIVAVLILIGGLNWLIDPFQYYRPSWLSPVLSINERFQKPGLAKHQTYDAVVVGDSMTQNFLPSSFKSKLGMDTLKLTINGSNLREQHLILKLALATGQVKTVFWALKVSPALVDPHEVEAAMPLYLYDELWWNDYAYWFNIDVLFESLNTLRNSLGIFSQPYELDTMNTWHQRYIFSEERAWLSFNQAGCANQVALSHSLANFEQNVLSLVAQHPEVKFYLFFPPYSVLNAVHSFLSHEDAYRLRLAKAAAVAARLEPFDHVKIFDFRTVNAITHDLNQYMDMAHYGIEINEFMIEAFASEAYLVSAADFAQRNVELTNQVQQFIAQHAQRVGLNCR